MKKIDNENTEMTSEDVIALCVENYTERDFLLKFKQMVKQEMMNEFVNRVKNISLFEKVEINL